VQEIVTKAHQDKRHNLSHEDIDAGLTRLEQRGLAGALREVQQTIRKVRLTAPDQFHVAGLRTAQYDYCADLNWMIRNLEGIVQVVCAIAILEPTPGGEAACGAAGLALGLLLLQRSWYC
jgi:hypothetical protein